MIRCTSADKVTIIYCMHWWFFVWIPCNASAIGRSSIRNGSSWNTYTPATKISRNSGSFWLHGVDPILRSLSVERERCIQSFLCSAYSLIIERQYCEWSTPSDKRPEGGWERLSPNQTFFLGIHLAIQRAVVGFGEIDRIGQWSDHSIGTQTHETGGH